MFKNRSNILRKKFKDQGPKKVLVIGASTGYGLASRIVSAFGYGAATLGVFFERPADGRRTASAGYYHTVAFEREAEQRGLYTKHINGDAFCDEIKAKAIEAIKRDLGKVDLVIYSLASPKRRHPRDGQLYSSILKPIKETFVNKTVDTHKAEVKEICIEAANPEEIEATIKVMGGEDWAMWIDQLLGAGVLEEGATTLAYSYIGPKITYPIYRSGTIGKAKEDLEKTQRAINEKMQRIKGKAFVSVNKALVTQSSSAIPVVPLYISILYKWMKEASSHEGCIEQIARLYLDHLYAPEGPKLDEKGRIRMDDWELAESIQAKVDQTWPEINTENLSSLSDVAGYQKEFLRLFGFEFDGVDYEEDTDVEIKLKHAL